LLFEKRIRIDRVIKYDAISSLAIACNPIMKNGCDIKKREDKNPTIFPKYFDDNR
jgi:hypothetical protein